MVSAVALAAAESAAASPGGARCLTMLPTVRLHCLVNEVRAAHGVRPLVRVRRLDRAAALQAGAIRACRTLSHTPCRRPFGTSFARAGYPLRNRVVAENLAWGTGSLASADAIVDAWMRSPGHRTNLLSPRFTRVGIARRAATLDGAGRVVVWVLALAGR